MDRVTEAFTWPFRDPEWLPKVLIIALILLIPIVGAINGIGWMLATLDRLRAGEERLAPANFTHLGRGIRLFTVELVYGLCIAAIVLVILLPAVALEVNQGRGSGSVPVIGAAIFLNLLGVSVSTVLSLALTFAMPAIVLATDSGGIGGGLRIGDVVRRSRINLNHNTLIAGLMLIAASFIGSLGSIACVIGVVVTSAYALAMQAWIIRSFETG